MVNSTGHIFGQPLHVLGHAFFVKHEGALPGSRKTASVTNRHHLFGATLAKRKRLSQVFQEHYIGTAIGEQQSQLRDVDIDLRERHLIAVFGGGITGDQILSFTGFRSRQFDDHRVEQVKKLKLLRDQITILQTVGG